MALAITYLYGHLIVKESSKCSLLARQQQNRVEGYYQQSLTPAFLPGLSSWNFLFCSESSFFTQTKIKAEYSYLHWHNKIVVISWRCHALFVLPFLFLCSLLHYDGTPQFAWKMFTLSLGLNSSITSFWSPHRIPILGYERTNLPVLEVAL